MKEPKRLKRIQQPTGRMLSVSGQAAEKADATTDLTTSDRPLHDYVAEVSERTDVRVGLPLPLGAYARGEGVNSAFFSRHASRVRLELFDHPEDATAARVIDLDAARNRTGDVWHVWIEGIRPGQLYAYRVDGGQMKGAVPIAESLRIRSILHMDYRSTCAKPDSFGLQNDEGVIHENS